MSKDVPDPLHDPARLDALHALELLDTPAEPAYDRLTRLAARLLDAPIVLMSLVDEDRQFFKSSVGLDGPWATQRETPLSYSFCQYIVGSSLPLIINDARERPLLCDSPAVTKLGMVAYAGFPLFTPAGQPLGSLCVIDSTPREWTDEHIEILRELAALVMAEIKLRSDAIERSRAEQALREELASRPAIKEELQQQRDLYDVLLRGLSDLGEGVMVGEGERIIFANAAMSQLSGYSHEELLQLDSAADLALPTNQLASADRLRRLGFGEEIGRFEGGLRHKAGHIVQLEIATKVLRYGDRVQFLSVMRDITARKHAEQALAEREAMLRAIGNNLPNGMIYQVVQEAPDKLYFTYVSEGAARSAGVAPEQIYADPSLVLNQIVEEDQARYWAAEAESFQNLSIFDVEVRMRPPSGELTWRHIRSKPRRLEDGRLAWDGFSIDITDRKHAEAALRESEDRYRSFFAHSIDAILLTAPDGSIFAANPAACRIFERSEAEICQAGRDGLLDTSDPRLAAALAQRARTGSFRGELTLLRRDGTPFPGEVSTAIFKDRDGLDKTSMIIRDITERKRAEHEREELIGALKEALANIKTLRGLLPICASCKKIRDDSGYWSQIEAYIQAHSDAVFTHGICPDCAARLYDDV